ncbi:MAG: relaxase, partial [bacterium]
LYEQLEAMKALHQTERLRLDAGQKQRHELETKERANRIRKGFMGIWDRLTGEYAKARKQNEMEAFFALNRDRKQRHDLVAAHLKDRQALQVKIMEVRNKQTKMILNLYQHSAHYRHLEKGGQAGRDNSRTQSAPRKRDKGLELG